jgi:pyrroline-5-carboxylate reductase
MKVGFVGSGNMAAALARGLAAHAPGVTMTFTDSGSGRAAELAAELGGEAVPTPAEIAPGAELLILAVKPGALGDVAPDLSGFSGPLVSVLGATPSAALSDAIPEATVLRAMPNVAVEVGRGVICHAPPADPEALADPLALLAHVATLIELPEEQLDAATAVMGCSPAYLAYACGALIAAGERAGLAPDLSRELVSLTAAGTGELLLGHDPAALQRAVASPGGSTEAGLQALATGRADEAFIAAVDASLARMAGTR